MNHVIAGLKVYIVLAISLIGILAGPVFGLIFAAKFASDIMDKGNISSNVERDKI